MKINFIAYNIKQLENILRGNVIWYVFVLMFVENLKTTKMKNEKYYIVRADRAGVFFGQIESKAEKFIAMANVRKIHYWEGAAAVEQISQSGVGNGSRLTVTVPKMEIADPIQIIECTENATENLLNQKEWKQ